MYQVFSEHSTCSTIQRTHCSLFLGLTNGSIAATVEQKMRNVYEW
jgi:hypothetical protein